MDRYIEALMVILKMLKVSSGRKKTGQIIALQLAILLREKWGKVAAVRAGEAAGRWRHLQEGAASEMLGRGSGSSGREDNCVTCLH